MTDTGRLTRARGAALAFGVLMFAAATLVTYPIARYSMFTGFREYDDEGLMLVGLKSFLNHGWLYDVYSFYGPFYYEFWGGVFSVLGISVSHDSGRAVTTVVWVLSSLLIGLSTWRMTGIVLGLVTQLAVFHELSSLRAEPMHPGGTIILLISAMMALSCFVRGRTSPLWMALLGGAIGALILVKINVGIFALAAVALVCAVSYPALGRRRWLRPVVELGVVTLPLLLMSSKLGEAWVRQYALHVSAAALALVIVLRVRSVGRRDSKELWWLGGGFLAVGITVLLVMIAAGTSPSGLIDMITLPLRFVSLRSAPLILPNWSYVLDLLALVAALCYYCVARNREARPSQTWAWLVATLSILIGLVMAFSGFGVIALGPVVIVGTTQLAQLGFVCLAWVALVQPPDKPGDRTQFARLLLPPVAVLQTLHAFPVAGSQVSWSILLLIPVGALCIANGIRWMGFALGHRSAQRGPIVVGAIAIATAVAVVVLLASIELKQGLDQVRAAYNGSVSLRLPGAKDVHVSAREAATYQATVAAIDKNCKSFVTLPGMNSFYIWTEQKPPAGYTSITETSLLDDERQRRNIEATRSIVGLCKLENASLARWWNAAEVIQPDGALVRYLHHGFVPIANFGDYELLKREGRDSR